MKYSIAALSAVVAGVVAQPQFLNTGFELQQSQPFTLLFSGCTTGCEIVLQEGPQTNTQTVQVITPSATGGSYTFTPENIPSGTYNFKIVDSTGDSNYSGQFTYQGTGAFTSSVTGSASAMASVSATESASTSRAETSSAAATTTSAEPTTFTTSKVTSHTASSTTATSASSTTETSVTETSASATTTSVKSSTTVAASTTKSRASTSTEESTSAATSAAPTPANPPTSAGVRVSSPMALMAGLAIAIACLS